MCENIKPIVVTLSEASLDGQQGILAPPVLCRIDMHEIHHVGYYDKDLTKRSPNCAFRR